MELMFNLYRSNSNVIVYVAVLVVIVAAIILFSVLKFNCKKKINFRCLYLSIGVLFCQRMNEDNGYDL